MSFRDTSTTTSALTAFVSTVLDPVPAYQTADAPESRGDEVRTGLDRSSFVAEGLQTVNRLLARLSGGRSWWAHFKFTRINIEMIFLRKKIEEVARVRRVCVRATSDIVRRRSLVRATPECRPAHRAVATRAPHRAGGTP